MNTKGEKRSTKKRNFPIATGVIRTKAELNYLLKVKEFPIIMDKEMRYVIPLIEVVA